MRSSVVRMSVMRKPLQVWLEPEALDALRSEARRQKRSLAGMSRVALESGLADAIRRRQAGESLPPAIEEDSAEQSGPTGLAGEIARKDRERAEHYVREAERRLATCGDKNREKYLDALDYARKRLKVDA